MWKSPKFLLFGATVLLCILLVAWMGLAAGERYFLRQLALQSESTLRLATAGLRGALMRYEPLPTLIADKADIKLLLANPGDKTRLELVNRQLKRITEDVGASDIYVLDKRGLTVASSNFDQDISFLGQNFSYRPYFSDAISGQRARYFALGTTSLKRGYYFSAPVRSAGRIAGVVAVKIGVNALEENWRGAETEILVSDTDGVVFMSSRKEWLFKSLDPLTDDARASITNSRRYPLDQLSELGVVYSPSDANAGNLITVPDANGSRTYLMNQQFMPDADWTIRVLAPRSTATQQAYSALAIGVLLVLLLGLVAAILAQRRARMMQSLMAQREAQEFLEKRVEERTADLNTANAKLKIEVKERTQAEEQLRKTQNELVQAGKLAALGQMSAALSHELNQPLAAVKSYADNAGAFLDRDRPNDARENIGRISEMADRMAEISTHLRNFARKPQERIGDVRLADVLNGAAQIMSSKLRKSGAILTIDQPDQGLAARGGQVRLQQVIVNLINNALDAMKNQREQHIQISTEAAGDEISITVRDHGPGLKDDLIEKIFDPFFTTKGINEGLGLGLSISYNIIRDFGGNLSAQNHDEGGAVFTITLERCEPLKGAAQ